MELQSVEILNFRSIERAAIDFGKRCRILVGINESGKSNVLKALSSLGSYVPSPVYDVREPLPSESPVEESRIRFRFRFDSKETKHLGHELSTRVLASAPQKVGLLINQGKALTLFDVAQIRNYGNYVVDVINSTKSGRYYGLSGDEYALCEGWLKPSDTCPADVTVEIKGVGSVTLKQAAVVRRGDFDSLPDEYFAPADLKDVDRALGATVIKIIEESLPDVLFWQYAEENLLPPSG